MLNKFIVGVKGIPGRHLGNDKIYERQQHLAESCSRQLLRNKINKLLGKVISINGETSKIIDANLRDKSDRTLMLLPERSDEFLDSAIKTTKDGGIIHYYSHIHADKKSEAGILSEKHYLEVTPIKSEILKSKIVRPVGPRYYQTVVDVKISK